MRTSRASMAVLGDVADSARMPELHALSATELLELYGARSLSPVEVVESLLARGERVGPSRNAVGAVYAEEALAQAREAERRYLASDARPLEGLPLAIKDELEIAGKRTTFGSLLFENAVSESTDPAVSRLVDAGAIVHAR